MIDIVMLIVIYIVLTSIAYIATKGGDTTIYGKKIRFLPGGFLLFIGRERIPRMRRSLSKGCSALLIVSIVIGMAIFYIWFLPEILSKTVIPYILYLSGKTSIAPEPSLIPVPLAFMYRDILMYIIVAIGIGVVVHETAHAIVALREGVKLRSWGIGILFLMPIAFVEPDDNEFNRASVRSRLNIVSAGIFANALVALATFLVFQMVQYYVLPMYGNTTSVVIAASVDCSICIPSDVCPAKTFETPTIIYSINSTRIYNTTQIEWILRHARMNTSIQITLCSFDGRCRNTTVELYAYSKKIWNTNKTMVPCLGMQMQNAIAFEKNGSVYINRWVIELLYYLNFVFMINLSLYALNSIPFIISDGSLFISIASEKFEWLGHLARTRVIDIINIFIIAIAAGISTYLLLRP